MSLTLHAWSVETDRPAGDRPAGARPAGARLVGALSAHDLTLSFPAEGIVRISLHPPGKPFEPTIAIVDPTSRLPLDARETPEGVRVTGPGLTLLLDRKRFSITLMDDHGKVIQAGITPVLDEGVWRLAVPMSEATRCYGLGEKTGYLDKRGRRYVMWNTDDPSPHIDTLDPMYVSIPWAILCEKGRAVGVYLDDPMRTQWDVGAGVPDHLVVTTPRDGLDLYMVDGPRLAQVVERFTGLTGRMPMPPRWALGYQQSRWSYDSADRMRQVVREYRERKIPLDVLYADIDTMDGYRVFTWSPETFPDPPGLMAELREQGVKVVPIVDPGVKKDGDYPVFAQGIDQGLFVGDKDGLPLVGMVWPGQVCFPDFANPRTRVWWGDLHRAYLDVGVAGIWNDMNEPSLFDSPTKTMPLDARHGEDGSLPHEVAHNLYGSQMSQATREGLLRLRPDERPFVLTRAGFAGLQRHAAVWTGDNFSIWAHLEMSLPMLMNMGLSGLAFVGPDVGGFSGNCGGELLARWMQVGAFTPFFRNHTAKGTRDQEPWVFGAQVEEVCRQAVRMRYQWLPYLYTAFWRAATHGTPVLRPLLYDFPDDPVLETLHDQAMVGSDLMMAPIMRPGATHRLVYLPEGEWIALWTGDRHTGRSWLPVSAPLEQLPLFVRAGAVIPRGPWAPHVEAIAPETLELHLHPAPRMHGAWIDDDGATLAYQRGAYNHWAFEGSLDQGRLSLSVRLLHGGYDSPTRRVSLVLHGIGAVTDVSFEGQAVPVSLRGQDVVLAHALAAGTWEMSVLP